MIAKADQGICDVFGKEFREKSMRSQNGIEIHSRKFNELTDVDKFFNIN